MKNKITLDGLRQFCSNHEWVTTDQIAKHFGVTKQQAQLTIGYAKKSPNVDVEVNRIYDEHNTLQGVEYRVTSRTERPPTDVPPKKWQHVFGLMNKSAH